MADPNEFIAMRHPETGGFNDTITRGAFEGFFREKGWVEVSKAAGTAEQVLDKPVEDVKALSLDELKKVATRLGVVTPDNVKKDELVKLIEGGQG